MAKFDLNSLNLLINGILLERIGIRFKEESLKFHGVILDELFTWKQHINHINKNSKSNKSKLFLIRIVSKHILPLFSHILAWRNENILKCTVVLQKQAIRTI